MSAETNKLKLKKPSFTDEIEKTIRELGENFDTLDLISDDYVSATPTSGDYVRTKRLYNTSPIYGGFVGWVNVRTGKAAPMWRSLKAYVNGDYIIPNVDNGHVYICVQSGQSAFTEPIFPVSTGVEFNDTRMSSTWAATTQYKLNDIVLPTIDNGRFYICIQAGESGNTEPPWQQVDGATTYDKNASWATYRITRWKEAGSAALFYPFGKIG
ncbi:hypothetical protein [Paenibacillus xylanexedens]|uniref:hypothetical protein n=1 Tax=Paenibacillus xylanexedens TaxID=528191 RepID=UPI000F533FBD|nr:hypothetical protein [Paenibacillus xylanexedens]RPK28785.1 hypothetical protein EDO6_04312 [Paenibacillus xylanexedens]